MARTERLVTTVIPVFNRAVEIVEAVESVLKQTYEHKQIIIVDDGSTDDTARVTEDLARSYPGTIRVLHKDNAGPGPARQAGIEVATGDFIQYLDSDDILMPRKFELQVKGLMKHPECGVAYGKSRTYHRDKEPTDIPWKRTGEKIETMFPAFLQSRWWGTSTPLYRRDVIDKAGPWLPLWNEEDWEYDCRVAKQGVKLHFCDEFVSDQRWNDRPRLSSDGTTDPVKLTDRAKAHRLIYGHARAFGITSSAPEMQHFARELFLLCRQCGVAELEEDARSLFQLALEASEPTRRAKLDFRIYELAASAIGWTRTGRLAHALDKVRRSGRNH